MKAKVDGGTIPLMIRHAFRSASNQEFLKSRFDVDAEDGLPTIVQRNGNGITVNRGTSVTEVGQESTDEN